MTLNTESLVEAYIRDPASLSDQQRSHVRQLLKTDMEAQYFAEFFEEFYTELHALPSDFGKVETFLRALFNSPTTVHLALRKPKITDTRLGLSYPTVLSASTSDSKGKFSSIGSVIADDGNIVIRFIMDREAVEGRGYVVSKDPLFLDHAVLSAPSIGKHFLSDDEGRFRFKMSESDLTTLVNQDLILRRPVKKLELREKDLINSSENKLDVPGNKKLFIQLKNKNLETWTDSNSDPFLLCIQPSNSVTPFIRQVGGSPISIALVDVPRTVRITIYD